MQDPSQFVVQLRNGRASVQLAPGIGGAITGFHWDVDGRRIDWLRPTDGAALAKGRAENVSCFPLVPFSNRVRDGRFSFAGREVRLSVDRENPHALHGHGWRAPWTIEQLSADRLTLSYSHAADTWPWPYRAEQRFALTERALSVELVLTNCSNAPMPCGLGLHPYFPRDAQTRLTARVDAMWEADADVLPTRLVRCTPDPSVGLSIDAVALDNAFTGWGGAAEIAWPERRARLRMQADVPLRVLVVFSPPGRSFFCAEPVSNITDGFNRPGGAHGSGVIVLAPGQSVGAAVRFLPQIDFA